ncbi:MAG: aldo/keto reductase [Lentisphaeria bacterium]|jgi:predicted aldo/keto reductase-like oxidoreductase|nr:aldo/keto reductase [Lentisphaeria bacterium]
MSIVAPAHAEPLIRHDETMRYRPFGKTGWQVSALSFGCMRLQDNPELNKELISTAVDLGVNYFESTRYYLGGTCQHRTAPGLEGKTAGVIVSGKERINPDQTAYLFRREIERQLDILGLTHFKFFQVGWFRWENMPHLLKRGGVLEAIRRAKDEGLIQCVGFTGHDTPENFIKCIETGLFDSITVPYNLINRSYEPTIRRAGQLGVGVVAMCPVAGGVLACESSRLREALKMDLPTTEMALRFVLSNPDVSTACSGMNTLEQLEENVRTVRNFDPAEQGDFAAMCEGLDRLRAELGDKFCTACRYCMPCPEGVDIPRHLDLYRQWKAFGLEDAARRGVARMPEDKSLVRCTKCGACVAACPNDLPVPDMLAELARLAEG